MTSKQVPPSLIFVFADQLRYQSCGYTGDKQARTPNIDRFAAESVNFYNAVSGYPVCGPYRNSLFTGKYPSSTGMVINELRCLPDPEAFGHIVSEHGYQTAYIGKWHLYGRNHEEQFVPPGEYRLGFQDYWAANNFNHHYYQGFYYQDTDERHEMVGYEPDIQTDMAIEYLEEKRDKTKPFVMFLSYGTPHDPWKNENCPSEYTQMFQNERFPEPANFRDGSAEYWNPKMTKEWFKETWKPDRERKMQVYYAMTANLDRNFGRILNTVHDSGLDSNTIVVFTSDHGEMFGAQGRIAKKIFYEEAVRIPFLIRWKGRTSPGQMTDACLNTPDIMPTLLDLMDLPIPLSVEGMSLKNQVLGQEGAEPEAAFMQGMGHTYQWLNGDEWRALRDKQFTYAVMKADGAEYLFNHKTDPFQLHNLIGKSEYKSKLDHYRRMLHERMNQLNDEFACCTWYRDHWTEDRVVMKSSIR